MATVAQRLTRFFFIVSLLLFPLTELGRIQMSSLVAITLNDITVACVVGIWVIGAILKKNKRKWPFFTREIGFVGVVFFASLVFNSYRYDARELLISSFYTLRWIMYTGMYFVVADFDKNTKEFVKKVLVFAGAAVVFVGYVQYLLYSNLRNLYYLGWDEHLYRMFSSFLDPNFAGSFFVLFFIFLNGLIFQKKMSRVLLCVLAILTACSIFLTFSRSALIMFISAIVTFLFIKNRKQLAILLVFFILMITFVLQYVNKTEGTNFFRISSIDARLVSAQKALIIFLDNPLYGIGFNAYRYAQEAHGFLKPNPKIAADHSASATDNSVLFVLATTGITGLLFYGYLWYSMLSKTISAWGDDKNIQEQVVVISILSLLINSLFINSLFYPFLMQWLWIQIGLRENR